MKSRHTINNSRFSSRLCHVANGLNIKTVGGLRTFLKKCSPNIKLGSTRGAQLLREIERYLS